MTKDEEIFLKERVGILEETVSELLCYLRDNSNTTHDYVNYKRMFSEAEKKAAAAETIYNTDKGYVNNGQK